MLSGHPQQVDFPANQEFQSNFSVSFVQWGRAQANGLPTEFNIRLSKDKQHLGGFKLTMMRTSGEMLGISAAIK